MKIAWKKIDWQKIDSSVSQAALPQRDFSLSAIKVTQAAIDWLGYPPAFHGVALTLNLRSKHATPLETREALCVLNFFATLSFWMNRLRRASLPLIARTRQC
jgi:hypothetical protein